MREIGVVLLRPSIALGGQQRLGAAPFHSWSPHLRWGLLRRRRGYFGRLRSSTERQDVEADDRQAGDQERNAEPIQVGRGALWNDSVKWMNKR